jgi:superoxide dismutase, Cu-Zn family
MKRIATIGTALALLLAGCATMGGNGPKATAKLEPTKGNTVAGSVTFVERGGKVVVTANVTGLKPGAEHGFHVHEKGDCSSGDGMSTGGHFNPDAKPHGPQDAAHHAGDLPALKADAAGAANATFTLDGVTVAPGAASIVGRGLIVHKDPDDYKTQPTGNSGARIACAVIQAG